MFNRILHRTEGVIRWLSHEKLESGLMKLRTSVGEPTESDKSKKPLEHGVAPTREKIITKPTSGSVERMGEKCTRVSTF